MPMDLMRYSILSSVAATASAATTPLSETRAAKRDKVRRAVVWYAKKTKMLDNLDEAFPSCLNTKQLLRSEWISGVMVSFGVGFPLIKL